MRSTNINFKRGILFFVYNATCWLEKCPEIRSIFVNRCLLASFVVNEFILGMGYLSLLVMLFNER